MRKFSFSLVLDMLIFISFTGLEHFLDELDDSIEAKVPFDSYLPHIAWNPELEVIEVIGDFVWPYTKKHKNVKYEKNHYFLANFEFWNKSNRTCFDGRSYSAVRFLPNIGTVMIGGILDYKTLLTADLQLG